MANYSYKNFVLPPDCIVFPRVFFTDWFESLGKQYFDMFMYLWCRCDEAGFVLITPNHILQMGIKADKSVSRNTMDAFVKIMNYDGKERLIVLNAGSLFFFAEFIDVHRAGTLVLSHQADAQIFRTLVSKGLSEGYVKSRFNIVDDLSDINERRLSVEINEEIRKKVKVGKRDYDAYLDYQVIPLFEKKLKYSHEERKLLYQNIAYIYYEGLGKHLGKVAQRAGSAIFHVWFTRFYDSDYALLIHFVTENRYSKLNLDLALILNCLLYKLPQEKWGSQYLVQAPDQQAPQK